jgi:glutathione S-transferase
MLTIYGRRTSANVMKSLWVAAELGLEHVQVDVGGPFGGTDSPDYRAKNPNGLVPTIDDDGFLLWESNAITRYLCAKHGLGRLCPTDSRERAIADQWMDWQLGTVTPMMTPIFVGLVRTPLERRDLEGIRRAIEHGIRIWGILDRQLADHAYTLGDTFTMADVPLGPWAHRWFALVEQRPSMPHLEAWYQRLGQRPAFRTHCMIPIV